MIIKNQKLEKFIVSWFKQKFPVKKFIPGKSFIASSGKLFNEKELIYGCQAVLDGWWTEGRFTIEFEKKLAKILGIKHCLTTNSGSSANLLAISALTSPSLGKKRLKEGDEVITTAACFPTTVNPIIINHLIPVFVDIKLGTYNIDFSQLSQALSRKTKAIILTHTLGNPFNVDLVVNFCRRRHLWLIEDNCDALGAKYKNKFTGSFGHLSTLSFYPAHQITSGEGGAVLTSNNLLAKIIRSMRDWGRDCWCPTGKNNTCKKRFSWKLGDLPFGYDHKYIYSEIGYNLKMTDIEAAIGLAQLEKLTKFTKTRRRNFDFLYQRFKKWQNYFFLPKSEAHASPSWFGFPLTIKPMVNFKRNELLTYLARHNIDSRLLFAGNITKQPYFIKNKVKYRLASSLRNTNNALNNTFWLGNHPSLNQQQLNFIVNTIGKFLKNKTS